ncbi:MAG: hypothetical protein ACE5HI_09255 [bacterium]
MKTGFRILTIVGVLIFFFTNSQAQGERGKFGFGVSDIAGTGQSNFVLTGRYWVQNEMAFDAGFGLHANSQDVFVLSGGLIKTISGGDKVYPYFGGKLDILFLDAPLDDVVSLGGVFGAEYFVIKRFSILGESQFVIDIDGGTTVRTQATLSVLFYLN